MESLEGGVIPETLPEPDDYVYDRLVIDENPKKGELNYEKEA